METNFVDKKARATINMIAVLCVLVSQGVFGLVILLLLALNPSGTGEAGMAFFALPVLIFNILFAMLLGYGIYKRNTVARAIELAVVILGIPFSLGLFLKFGSQFKVGGNIAELVIPLFYGIQLIGKGVIIYFLAINKSVHSQFSKSK